MEFQERLNDAKFDVFKDVYHCTNPQEIVDLVTFTEEILNGKLHFCAVYINQLAVQSIAG